MPPILGGEPVRPSYLAFAFALALALALAMALALALALALAFAVALRGRMGRRCRPGVRANRTPVF
jgi:hypothetical protein